MASGWLFKKKSITMQHGNMNVKSKKKTLIDMCQSCRTHFNISTGLHSSSQLKMGETIMLKCRQSLKCLGICRNYCGQATEIEGEGRVQAKRINM